MRRVDSRRLQLFGTHRSGRVVVAVRQRHSHQQRLLRHALSTVLPDHTAHRSTDRHHALDTFDFRPKRRAVRVHVSTRVLGTGVALAAKCERHQSAHGEQQPYGNAKRHLFCTFVAWQHQLHAAECAQFLAKRRDSIAYDRVWWVRSAEWWSHHTLRSVYVVADHAEWHGRIWMSGWFRRHCYALHRSWRLSKGTLNHYFFKIFAF